MVRLIKVLRSHAKGLVSLWDPGFPNLGLRDFVSTRGPFCASHVPLCAFWEPAG